MKYRYVAAALAVVATSALAEDFARVISSAPVVEPIPGTSNSRIVRYVVKYEYQGKQYTVNLPSDPGPRIRIQGAANYAPPAVPSAPPTRVVVPSAPPVVVPVPPPPAVPVATVPVPPPVFVTPPPVVYAQPYYPYPAPYPYPYVGAYNPVVPFGLGVGIGIGIAGGWGWGGGGYGWRGGGGHWHR